MALTATEQLQLQELGIPSLPYPMDQVIHQIGLNSSLNFQRNTKPVDEMVNPLAGSYVSKMNGTIGLLYQGNNTTIRGLQWLMVSSIAATIYTYAEVSGATEAQALTFFEDEIFQVLENMSLVTVDEKAAYDAI